jgi:CheY-like chemotaxis protein/HEAT repeat protein
MGVINSSHFLDEVKHVINNNDQIKGEILLGHLDQLDAKVQQEVISLLGGSDQEVVVTLLARLLVLGKELAVPALVIRAMLLGKILRNRQQFITVLKDETVGFRLPLILIAGEVQLVEAVPVLLNIMADTQESDLLQCCLTALGAIGDPAATNVLSDFLYSGQRELVIAAIEALSNIDTPTSVQRLAERMGTDRELDLLILDAFAHLQDNLALEQLNLAIQSHHAYIRNHAKKKLTKIGDKAIPILTQNLLQQDDPDLLVHSLNVLGFIGDLSAVRAIRKLLHNEPKDANVRFAAYESMGMMPLAKGAYVLAEGLLDSVGHVRIAAAKAIEWNCDDVLIAGVKNMIAAGGREAEMVIEAFLNSESHKIVLAMAELEIFKTMSVEYLNNRAHPDVKNAYLKFFKEHEFQDLVDGLLGEDDVSRQQGVTVFAVDDSRMILSIYKNTLFQLGMEGQLFEFPVTALEQAVQEKPDIVLTDLNMPDMTGVELTVALRKTYSAKELPIIMVTTQSDSPDHKAAYDAGVNRILHKPFTAEDIETAIVEVLAEAGKA